MGFSRQEYWSALPCLSPDPDPGIEPASLMSPILGRWGFLFTIGALWEAFLVAKMVKNLPAMQETWVWSLGQEDPLVEEMATHSRILTSRIPWTEEPGRYSPLGRKESGTNEQLTPSLAFVICRLFNDDHSDQHKVEKCLLWSSAHFSVSFFVFFIAELLVYFRG